MMICQHCGSNNDPKSKFCTRCGKPLQPSPSAGTPPAPMPGAAVPPPAPSASFGTQSSSVPPAPTASAAAAQTSATDRTRRWLVWAIVAVAIVVVAVIAGLLTYNAELWGGKTLPQAQAATSTSKDAVSADTVAAQLRSKGLHVKKTKEFSGAKKGAFLGYRGADLFLVMGRITAPVLPGWFLGKIGLAAGVVGADVGVFMTGACPK